MIQLTDEMVTEIRKRAEIEANQAMSRVLQMVCDRLEQVEEDDSEDDQCLLNDYAAGWLEGRIALANELLALLKIEGSDRSGTTNE